jgi:hypothetical protein
METKTETKLDVLDGEAKARRFNIALFVVSELLCTGVLVLLAVLYM